MRGRKRTTPSPLERARGRAGFPEGQHLQSKKRFQGPGLALGRTSGPPSIRECPDFPTLCSQTGLTWASPPPLPLGAPSTLLRNLGPRPTPSAPSSPVPHPCGLQRGHQLTLTSSGEASVAGPTDSETGSNHTGWCARQSFPLRAGRGGRRGRGLEFPRRRPIFTPSEAFCCLSAPQVTRL